MHHKRLLLGFLLGLFTGAVYHYTHKETPREHDSLYKLVGRLQGKVEEAKDSNSELHAQIGRASDQVKDAATNVADQAKATAKQVADKVAPKVEEASEKASAKADEAADSIKSKTDDAADKVQQVADSAAKHAADTSRE